LPGTAGIQFFSVYLGCYKDHDGNWLALKKGRDDL